MRPALARQPFCQASCRRARARTSAQAWTQGRQRRGRSSNKQGQSESTEATMPATRGRELLRVRAPLDCSSAQAWERLLPSCIAEGGRERRCCGGRRSRRWTATSRPKSRLVAGRSLGRRRALHYARHALLIVAARAPTDWRRASSVSPFISRKTLALVLSAQRVRRCEGVHAC